MDGRVVIVAAVACLAAACGQTRVSDPRTDPSTLATSQPSVTTSVATRSNTAYPTLPATDPYPHRPLIDHVSWTTTARGARLRVYPTRAGRDDMFPAAGDRAWAEVVAAAPGANTPAMRDQFACHWNWARLVAPDKPSWNLELWRPDVGYDATVQALCNPGGPEE